MAFAKLFDKVIDENFKNTPFTEEMVRRLLDSNENWHPTTPNYHVRCIKHRVERGRIIDNHDGTYKINDEFNRNAVSRKTKREKRIDATVNNVNSNVEGSVVFRRKNQELSENDANSLLAYLIFEFNAIVDEHNIENSGRYFEGTDPTFVTGIDVLTDINYVFKEIGIHALNRSNTGNLVYKDTMMSTLTNNWDIDSFPENFNSIDRTTLGEQAKNFVKSDYYVTLNEAKNKLLEMRETLEQNGKTVDRINIIQYIKNIMFNGCETENGRLCNLEENYRRIVENSKRDLLPHGFGNALTFDFLKELDNRIFDLPKPDLHVIQFLFFLYQDEENKNTMNEREIFKKYFLSNKSRENGGYHGVNISINEFRAMEMFVNVVNKMKHSYPVISNYIFDRLIYLLLSGKFFLEPDYNRKAYPGTDGIRKRILANLLKEQYKNIENKENIINEFINRLSRTNNNQ